MIEKTALRVFWTMVLLCVLCALVVIWAGPVIDQRFIPTFFIVGFAGFLIWAPLVAYRFLAKKL